MFLLDNLETLQRLDTLKVLPHHEDSWFVVRAICSLPAPTRVLLTGRYALADLAAQGVATCEVPDAPYGDVLRRMNRLDWPGDWDAARKRWLYGVLGGNHRALEWAAGLLSRQSVQAEELVDALQNIQVPPETPEAVADVVLEAMRQNLLLDRLLEELTPEQRRLLHWASLFRVPVTEDGFLVLADEADEKQVLADVDQLARRSLLESGEDFREDLTFFELPPIVRQLLQGEEDGEIDGDQRQALHARIGGYHVFQGRHVTRTWQDDLEAIHHYRVAERHIDADRLTESLADFYYRTSNYAASLVLTQPVVDRQTPPPPWWALD